MTARDDALTSMAFGGKPSSEDDKCRRLPSVLSERILVSISKTFQHKPWVCG